MFADTGPLLAAVDPDDQYHIDFPGTIHGDARTATAEKGRVIFETAVTRLVGFVDEWRA